MRYEDWDILLFPRDCKVPLKEFKVACHLVHDNELPQIHGSLGLPTVCCFVPSLAPGAPYKLSIHSWSTPPISQFTRAYGKYVDRVVFEARLFVDGRLVSSSSMNRAGPWPNVLKHSFDLTEDGELGPLSFPSFQRELLNQSFWSPADDLGRIKVVISESYPRDSLSVPLERVRNVMAFSFQHAPLEILESSAIAWPNTSMWRCMPFKGSLNLPSGQPDEDGSHAHSPRPRNNGMPTMLSWEQAISTASVLSLATKQRADMKEITADTQEVQSVPSLTDSDPFVEANAYFEWLNGIGMGLAGDSILHKNPREAIRATRISSTDISMPDYSSSNQTPPSAENITDSFISNKDDEADTTHMKVPTNTPIADLITQAEGVPLSILPNGTPLSVALDNSLNSSFLSQSTATPPQTVPTPAMEVKSRKENKAKQAASPRCLSTTGSTVEESVSIRKVSQQLYKASGNSIPINNLLPHESPQRCASAKSCGSTEKSMKRIRSFTPTSSKVFEDDEEPSRASPRIRLSNFE